MSRSCIDGEQEARHSFLQRQSDTGALNATHTSTEFLYIVQPGARFRDKPLITSVGSPHSTSETLSAFGPLLAADELVKSAKKDLSRKVPA